MTITGYIDPEAVIGRPAEDRASRREVADCRFALPMGNPPRTGRCQDCPADSRCPWALWPDVHPTAIVEALVTIDAGTKHRTTVGPRCFLMKKVHIGHDVMLGEGVEIAPNSSIGGHVVVGRNVKMGQGVMVKPFVTIGDGARIGLGAAVISDVPAYECWAGNPARLLYRLCQAGCGAKASDHTGGKWCADHDPHVGQLNVHDHAE